MVGTVLIRGDGIAASCCAQSLLNGNVTISVAKAARSRPTWILLSESSQTLLFDLFGDRDLLRDMPRIRKRVVSWGDKSEPLVLPHSALVAPEQVLVENLWQKIPVPSEQDERSPRWEILSSHNANSGVELLRFGSQIASSSDVCLRPQADRETCWIESLNDGWLFLFSAGEQRAHLISVGAEVEALLSDSRLVVAQVDSFSVASRTLPAYPRILSTLCGPGWLACGSAAVGFDPLGGEGAGNAVREAILASAVLRAMARGHDAHGLLAFYSARLMQGFLRHLQACRSFYSNGGSGAFWQSEVSLLQRGIDWSRGELRAISAPGYRLVDFDLVPLQ
jgi:hypothetical protein